MDENELVLSDVHACTLVPSMDSEDSLTDRYCTRFKFCLPHSLLKSEQNVSQFLIGNYQSSAAIADAIDGDGDSDPEITRSNQIPDSNWDNYILIQHAMATTLKHVGLQVWQGAVLLSDWLLENSVDISNAVILDLGTGTGLTSILSAFLGASCVFATDNDNDQLTLCKNNVMLNAGRLKISDDVIRVRHLDWTECSQVPDLLTSLMERKTGTDIEFNFIKDDIDCLASQLNLIIASDTIYQSDLIASFVKLLERLILMRIDTNITFFQILIVVERRIVFTVADRAVNSHEFDLFVQHLASLGSPKSSRYELSITELQVSSIPRRMHLSVNRESQLYGWLIKVNNQ